MARSAAAVAPRPAEPTAAELEAAANRARAMKEIMDDLDTEGDLTRFLAEYSRKIESYSGLKPPASRAAKKK